MCFSLYFGIAETPSKIRMRNVTGEALLISREVRAKAFAHNSRTLIALRTKRPSQRVNGEW